MASLIIHCPDCVPTGRVTLGRVEIGTTLNRDWDWVVNGQETIDGDDGTGLVGGLDMGDVYSDTLTRSGIDGRFYVGDNLFAETAHFEVYWDLESRTIRRLGTRRAGMKPEGSTCHVTFNELVVKDAHLFMSVFVGLRTGKFPSTLFRGVVYDDTDTREG